MMITLQQTLGITNSLTINGGRIKYKQDEVDNNDEDDNGKEHEHTSGEAFETPKSYLPPSVLRFLLDPDPLRFINHTL